MRYYHAPKTTRAIRPLSRRLRKGENSMNAILKRALIGAFIAISLLTAACQPTLADQIAEACANVEPGSEIPLNGGTITCAGKEAPAAQLTAPAQPEPTPAPAVAATNAPTTTGGVLVPFVDWTAWTLDNVVIDDAVHVRPSKPFEAAIQVEAGKVYQLKTDYLDDQPNTWKPGKRLYKFHVPKGLQAYALGYQGDNRTRLCMGSEGENWNILWLGTEAGNGTSALVYFVNTGENPPVNQLCP